MKNSKGIWWQMTHNAPLEVGSYNLSPSSGLRNITLYVSAGGLERINKMIKKEFSKNYKLISTINQLNNKTNGIQQTPNPANRRNKK